MFKLLNRTSVNPLRNIIQQYYHSNESIAVKHLRSYVNLTSQELSAIQNMASNLIKQVRTQQLSTNAIDKLMQKFKLSTDEGIALMCLSESLLRIPDNYTRNKLIRDKIVNGKWLQDNEQDLFVHALSWGITISGKIIDTPKNTLCGALHKVIASVGMPVIQQAMVVAVSLLGKKFVLAETIEQAIRLSTTKIKQGYTFSYDMLGEGAITDSDALHYMNNYIHAITTVGQHNAGNVFNGHGISVKLSAIYANYFTHKYAEVMSELYPRLRQLYILAKKYQIGLFIDAEEAHRLDLSLDLLEKLVEDPDLSGFQGIGIVIQAYQTRAFYVIDYVIDLAKRNNTRLMMRLVKGAYWDSEIKHAQVEGYTNYPVFTRKVYTDLSYLACTKKILQAQQYIYPLFATHNAYTLATIFIIAHGFEYEFQCLYGMGEQLYDQILGQDGFARVKCKIYAPVGNSKQLLAYLVRRLLENGANSSFVHQILDNTIPVEHLTQNVLELVDATQFLSNPLIKLPQDLYLPSPRKNSSGLNLSDYSVLLELENKLNNIPSNFHATSLVPHLKVNNNLSKTVCNPANTNEIIGISSDINCDDIPLVIQNAIAGFECWSNVDCQVRINTLLNMANLLEAQTALFLVLLVREAGKTLSDAHNEIREAVDFCRYYADQYNHDIHLSNAKAIGPILCISPWNFPLAIFLGEIASALVIGNSVIAKPSNQTNLIAYQTVKLLHQAGIPENVVQLTLGSGAVLGNCLSQQEAIKGIIFTGSTAVARMLNQNLSNKASDSLFIAETGGQNAMIVDSTALPEQVVTSIIQSGFNSAGQRCSALRVLYVQQEIADTIINMLKGAMDLLIVGNPMYLSTDIGPVIDSKAKNILMQHIDDMKMATPCFHQTPLNTACNTGIFVPPTIIEINNINQLKQEFFGPIVHIIRFASNELDAVIDEINSSRFGLTHGIYSRIQTVVNYVSQKINAGNIYVNRNMIGAVVGVQPFGGNELSGTGPKAGGPCYLYRLVNSTQIPPLNYTAIDSIDTNSDLDNFMQVLIQYGIDSTIYDSLKEYAKNVKANLLYHKKVTLCGASGESNMMVFNPRGILGAISSSEIELFKQIITALANHNEIICLKQHFNHDINLFKSLTSIHIVDKLEQILLNNQLQLVLYDNQLAWSDMIPIKQQLAQSTGPIVLNLHQQSDGFYSTIMLYHEKHISIDMTATNGNIELMNIIDDIKPLP